LWVERLHTATMFTKWDLQHSELWIYRIKSQSDWQIHEQELSTCHMSHCYILYNLLLYAHTCGYVLGKRGAHFRTCTIFLQASVACCSLIFPWTRLFIYKFSTKCLANSFIVESVIFDVATCLSTAFQWTWVSSKNCKCLLNEQNL
jgi:hypothetical protein